MRSPLGLIIAAALLLVAPHGARSEQKPAEQPEVVVDEAALLAREHLRQLSELAAAHNARGPGRIFVLIVKELPPGATVEEYALKRINQPPLTPDERNDRILVLVAVKDRKLRIETSRDVRRRLPDAFCKQVIDGIIAPKFKQKQYYEGLHAAVTALTAKLQE